MTRPIQKLKKRLTATQLINRKIKIEKRKTPENIQLRLQRKQSVSKWKKFKQSRFYSLFDLLNIMGKIPQTANTPTLKDQLTP